MLDLYFKAAKEQHQMWDGPLAGRLDELAAIFYRQGFCWDTGRRALRIAGRFNRFLQESGMTDETQVSKEQIETFLDSLGHAGSFRYALSDLNHLLDHLRSRGVLPTPEGDVSDHPFSGLLVRFDEHLRDVRGNTPLTREGYLHGARRLLHWLRERHGEESLASLDGRAVLEFITSLADRYPGGSWPNQLCSATRIFLVHRRFAWVIAPCNRRVAGARGQVYWGLQAS